MKPLKQWTSADVLEFVKGVDKRTWIKIALGFAGSFLVLVFFIIPAWIERPLLRRDIQSMEAQILQVNVLSRKRPAWEEDQTVFGELIDKTRTRVFTADEMALLLGQVSRKSAESHVEVLASKPLSEKVTFQAPYNLNYQPSGYEFTMQGGYHDLAKMVSRIESYEKLLRVQSIKIVPSEKTPDRHVAELKLWAVLSAAPAVAAPSAPAAGANGAK